VQQHIEPAERLGRSAHHVVDGPGITSVALHPRDAGAIGWPCLVICRDDVCPRLAEHLNRRIADSGSAAGDEDPPL
jgi:hypothetical protein